MNPEYTSMVERQKKDREALAIKHKREMTDMKVRQEQERSKFKQNRYVKSLNEFIEWQKEQ